MKRRGNKSAKVPNVKLRPAQAGSLRPVERLESSIWAQDSQVGSDDTNILDSCPRPFKGVIVCATGIVDKPTLFKQALELGATSVTAFTDRVTHLVAADHGGAKYMCALERKIPILQPSWITESYQVWLRGDDVDLQDTIDKYRLPIFSGVILSPSGIAEITRRTQINKLLTQHQGQYVKNLERPVKVTHLLCSGDEETDKMRYAEKFNSRGEAKIHLVWEEWFWDSLEFGGRFDEERYQVRRPRPERKSLPEPPTSPPPTSDLPSSHPELEPAPKPQSLVDSTEDEPASIKRVPAVTLQIWESLLKPRGYEVAGGRLVRSPSKAPSQRPMSIPPLESPTKNQAAARPSVLSSFRRIDSFSVVPLLKPRQPFQRTPTVSSLFAGISEGKDVSGQAGPSSNSDNAAVHLFVGLKFRALGEAKSANVRSAIEGCGGRVMSEEEADEDVDYVVVRLVSGSKFYKEEAVPEERSKYRTECWLERCIFDERICTPEEHVSFLPLGIETPVPGAERVNLSFSGLDQSEACWIRRLVRALGMCLSPNFSRRSTHLLCPSRTGAKFEKAQEWGVPVVDIEWMNEIVRIGAVQHSTTESPLGIRNGIEAGGGMRIDEDNNANTKYTHKGKGKETDCGIYDITNNTPPEAGISGPLAVESSNNPKSRPVQRMDTVFAPQLPRADSFGKAKGPLAPSACSSLQRLSRDPSTSTATSTSTSTPPRPPPSRSSEVDLEYISDPPTRAPSMSMLPPQSSSSSHPQPTASQINQEKRTTRIPSSKSPSPMKPPRKGGRGGGSPTKVSNEVTKALQESITSLLGKRRDEGDEGAAPTERPGKKVRPTSRAKTRNGLNDAPPQTPSPPPPIRYDDASYDDPFDLELHDELNVRSRGNECNTGEGEGTRVMYEDPGQRDEKRRLVNLLAGQSQDEVPSGGGNAGKRKGSVRRSNRIAGF